MQLAARCSPPVDRPETDSAVAMISETNQTIYSQLKLSLSLRLRRQVFLAVCDDLALRNHLAARLQSELAYPAPAENGQGQGRSSGCPQLVSLKLNLRNPNPMAQIAHWLTHHLPPSGASALPTIGFQILGVEQLTRQPAPGQRRFLSHLQEIEFYLPSLESSLLLWLSRPWLRSVQQSAPAFWEWHTALFEFEGDPTPILTSSTPLPQPDRAPASSRQLAQTVEAVQAAAPVVPQSEATLLDILNHDLAQLDHEQSHQTVALAATPKVVEADTESRDTSSPSPSSESPPPSLPPTSPPPTSPPSSPLTQTGSALDLTDLVLAAAAQDPLCDKHAAALQLLQRTEQLQEQQAPAAALAAAYHGLGNLYRDRIEQGYSDSQTLTIAIRAYEQTLEWLDGSSSLWPDVLNDLGNLYWMLSRGATQPAPTLTYLQQAVTTYQLALTRTNPQTRLQTYLMIQNNLGSAYGDLARLEQTAENLQQSIAAYEEVLRYRTLTEDPARYAATQNNLGTAYWNLAQHQQPLKHLQQAIAAYQEALQYYSSDRDPLHYAMIQNNLGTAYWNLAQHLKPSVNGKEGNGELSPVSLLRQAIAAYQTALTYRTLKAVAAAHAATQNNLGTAYWHLAIAPETSSENRQEFLKRATTAYKIALNTAQQLLASGKSAALTFDPASTQSNLGLAYYQLAVNRDSGWDVTKRSQHLELALNHHLLALQGWAHQPNFYQTALGHVIQTVRTFYSEFGIQGQTLAMSRIPAQLLSEVMQRL